MGVEPRRQRLGQCRREIGPAIAGDPVGEDDLARGLDPGRAVDFEMQAEMPGGRLDAAEPCAVAHRDAEEAPVPAEVFGPVGARDAGHRGIGMGCRFSCPPPRRGERDRTAPPGITIELVESPETANLARRDADLALRHGVPEAGNLFVSKVGAIAGALYRRRDGSSPGLRRSDHWVTYTEEQGHFVSARWLEQQIRASGGKVVLRASNLLMRLEAVRAGVGIGLLPCCAADGDPLLERATDPVPELAADYWVIVHRDLRRAACVRAVIDWIRRLFDQQRDVLAGTAGARVRDDPAQSDRGAARLTAAE
jgi:DNA-binding transcriptional LysR family regulator